MHYFLQITLALMVFFNLLSYTSQETHRSSCLYDPCYISLTKEVQDYDETSELLETRIPILNICERIINQVNNMKDIFLFRKTSLKDFFCTFPSKNNFFLRKKHYNKIKPYLPHIFLQLFSISEAVQNQFVNVYINLFGPAESISSERGFEEPRTNSTRFHESISSERDLEEPRTNSTRFHESISSERGFEEPRTNSTVFLLYIFEEFPLIDHELRPITKQYLEIAYQNAIQYGKNILPNYKETLIEFLTDETHNLG